MVQEQPEAALELLADFSQKNQVLFFTTSIALET